MAVPKVAAIHDLSGLGTCSLTAAAPRFTPRWGCRRVPCPRRCSATRRAFPATHASTCRGTSTPSPGSGKRAASVSTASTPAFSAERGRSGWSSGFSTRFYLSGTLLLVDPVLGDNGKLYPVFGRTMRDSLKSLVARADVITPNLTEACILADGDYASAARAQSLEPVWELAERLAGMGPRTVIVTGVHRGGAVSATRASTRGTGRRFSVGNRSVGGGRSFSGTRDLLASVLCGGLVRGRNGGGRAGKGGPPARGRDLRRGGRRHRSQRRRPL